MSFSPFRSTLMKAGLLAIAWVPLTNSRYSDSTSDSTGLTFTSALRMNQIQIIGTHNSYHFESTLAERPFQKILLPNTQNYWYSHAALDVQATYMSVRNFEIDVYADPEGGHYSNPVVRQLAGLAPLEGLDEPGIKVLHVADADVHPTCKTFIGCLTVVKNWSDAHPDHVPIPFMIEFKTGGDFVLIGGSTAIYWNDTTLLNGLDAEIRSVFGPDRLIVPDDIRVSNMTLEESVLSRGWPDLDSARGRVMFLMDNSLSALGSVYNAGAPNLEGRVVFTNSEPGQPDCAFQKLNDPTTAELLANIQEQVRLGYWVRTRSDVPLDTLLSDNVTSMREAAFKSGAQIVSTDFPAYGMSSRWMVDYAVRFKGGKAARCNPVNAPEGCEELELETEEYLRE